MKIVLEIAGIVFAAVGLFVPPLQALLPKIHPVVYYKQRLVRRSFYATGALLIAISAAFGPANLTWIALIILAAFILAGELLLVPRKLIPPLDRPLIKPALPDDLPDQATVIGVEIAGEARAYPLSLLIPHHIVNDLVAGIPVAATYCPACRSGYVFDPVVRGTRLTFEPVSVRRRNMVMKDRETGSVWQHETGTCLMGSLAGERLRTLNGEMSNWKTWIGEHPRTTVCLRPEDYRHPSPLGPIFERLLEHGPEKIVGPGLNEMDRRLDQHDFIIGITVAGISKAYPLAKIIEEGTIADTVGSAPVDVRYEATADRVRAFRDGEPIPVVRQWWLAWSEYHPRSELYE